MGSALFTRGVVVEEVEKDSALEKAGIKPIDVALAWERSSSTSENAKKERGDLKSVFDWFWLDNEQAPRGKVSLLIQRSNKTYTLDIPAGVWHAKVRPVLPASWLKFHSRATKAVRESRLEEAYRLWKRLSDRAFATGKLEIALWAKLETARTCKQAGKLDRSESLYKTVISTATAAGIAKATVEAWVEIADLRILIPRLTQALDDCAKAERQAQSIPEGHHLITAMLQARRARILWLLADLTQAKELSDSSISAYSTFAPVSSQLTTGLNLAGAILDDMGHLREAFDLYQQGMLLAKKLAGRDWLIVPILNNLSVIANARGDFTAAENFNQQAISIIRNKGERSLRLATLINNLGSMNYDRSHFDKAESLFKESLALYNELAPNSLETSRETLNLGQVAIARGDLAAAKRLCSESLRFRESNLPADALLLTSPLNCLSVVASQTQRFDEARELEGRILRIVESKAPGSLSMADSLLELSHITFIQPDLVASEAYAMRAEAIYKSLAPETYFHAGALHQLALVRASQGRVTEADDYFRHAMSALESQLTRAQESEIDKGAYRSSRGDFYQNYVIFLISIKKFDQAFQVLERWRAGAFLALLNQRELAFSEIPPDLDAELRQIAVEYNRIIEKLASTPASHPDVQGWRDQLLALRVRQGEVTKAILGASPKNAALRYPQPLDFEATRQTLDPGTAMLSYSVEPDETHAFVVAPGQPLKVFTLTVGRNQLLDQITTLRKLIQEPSPGSPSRRSRQEALDSLSRKLFEELMAPVAPALENTSRLLIINDGPLHLLPWGSLVTGSAQPGSKSPRYLVEWKAIHIALSATTYKELRASRRNPETRPNALLRLAAFGDPVYRVGKSDAVRNVADARFYLTERGFPFDPLPATRQEVEGIGALYGAEAREFLGSAATEENVKSLPRNTRIVHFATHAILDERSPLDSAVVLSIPEKFEEGKDNGLLQAWEIFERVRLDADLVVLSACETGLGKEMGGEGLIGLTRAFQYAGARSVMASLWKISDRTTAELMVRFHKHLKEGLPKDEALRAAQIELIRGPIQVKNEGKMEEIDASTPYYWAAFQLYGDWQ